MWRGCRRDHLDFINRLVPTVNTISSSLLQELGRLAVTYEPAIVREAIVDPFADAAYGLCPPEEFETAAKFFGWLIKDAGCIAPGKPSNRDPRELMTQDPRDLMRQWLSVTDPLRIAEDPECGYGPPTGCVS
jgi:hypothetical protein